MKEYMSDKKGINDRTLSIGVMYSKMGRVAERAELMYRQLEKQELPRVEDMQELVEWVEAIQMHAGVVRTLDSGKIFLDI